MQSVRSVATTIVAFLLVASLATAGEPAAGGRGGRGGMGFGAPGGFGGFGTSRMLLVNNESVQKELTISTDQKEKIAKIQTDMRSGMRGTGGRGAKDMSAEEKTKAREEMQKKTAEANKTAEAKLAEVLNKDQAKRLDEIYIQRASTRALLDEKVQKELKITKEQGEKVKGALDDEQKARQKIFEEMRGAGGAGGAGGTAMREKLEGLQKETLTKALGFLTADQKAAYEKAKGKEFKYEEPARGRGTGGRRGAKAEPKSTGV
jgi:Spy/CpxP family protein refolding chaperone